MDGDSGLGSSHTGPLGNKNTAVPLRCIPVSGVEKPHCVRICQMRELRTRSWVGEEKLGSLDWPGALWALEAIKCTWQVGSVFGKQVMEVRQKEM